jgi:hypothetical protein
MRPDSTEMRSIEMQLEQDKKRLPHWDDLRALEQMWDFCSDFPRGTPPHSIASWTQSWLKRRHRMPPPNLRAQLIKTALNAGWNIHTRSPWDLDELPDAYWG